MQPNVGRSNCILLHSVCDTRMYSSIVPLLSVVCVCCSGCRNMFSSISRRAANYHTSCCTFSSICPSTLWPSQQQHLHRSSVSPYSSSSSSRTTVIAAAAAVPTASSSTSNALINWVLSNGGSVNSVTMANLGGSDGGSGWGLVATEVS